MSIQISKYVIDANIFMEASRRYYPLDFAKPFWDGMRQFAENGNIVSIDRVLDEIEEGNDALKQWAEDIFLPYFQSTQNPETLREYVELVRWAESQNQYNQAAKDRFMEDSNADAWVLAYARANSCTIVTSEVPDANIKRSIPIPNVCAAYSIPYCDTFEMLRQLNFSF